MRVEEIKSKGRTIMFSFTFNVKVIFLNWSTEESLFVTECNTMVEGVDHKKNKENVLSN